MSKTPNRIQLEGRELERVSRLSDRIESDLLKVAERVLTTLYGKGHVQKVGSLRVFPNNSKIMVYDEKLTLVGVWENPPGVCRKPRKGEK